MDGNQTLGNNKDMTYREIERKFFNVSRDMRELVLQPLLKILTFLKISANQITYARVFIFVFGVMYPLFVKGELMIAILFYFFGFWLLDMLDGQLARHTKTDNDKGKFIDVYVDMMGYSFFIMGLAFLGVANIFILFYHVIIHGAVYIISIVQKNELVKSDWIIKPEANLVYFKFLAHLLVVIFIFLQINWMDLGFIILNIFMTISTIVYFIKMQKQIYKINK